MPGPSSPASLRSSPRRRGSTPSGASWSTAPRTTARCVTGWALLLVGRRRRVATHGVESTLHDDSILNRRVRRPQHAGFGRVAGTEVRIRGAPHDRWYAEPSG